MPRDKLEIVRRAFEEMGGDEFDAWDPEVEIINAEGWVIETTYRGHEGLRRWWDDLAEAFGEARVPHVARLLAPQLLGDLLGHQRGAAGTWRPRTSPGRMRSCGGASAETTHLGDERSFAFALALLVQPALAHGQAPLRDSVSAFGHVLETDFVGAGEAGPNGEDPVGSLTVSGFLDFTTRTTCLNVSGNAVVSGGRILNGRDAGRGFLSSSIDRGPPVDGKPVDVTVFSGLLPRPPRNCPSPGDAAPELLRPTGGGPFTSGDLVVVDAIERVPAGAPRARVRIMGVGPRAGVGLDTTRRGPSIRVRVCGPASPWCESISARARRGGIRRDGPEPAGRTSCARTGSAGSTGSAPRLPARPADAIAFGCGRGQAEHAGAGRLFGPSI